MGGEDEGAVMAGAYVATPAEIVDEGERLGAERICFWDGSYRFTGLDVSEVEALLPQVLAGRFKFQTRSAGRWTDLSNYQHVVHTRLLRELERQTFVDEPGFTPAELRAAASAQPRKFRGALRRLLYDTIERQLRRPVRGGLRGVVAYFSQFADEWADDEYFQFFLTYFSLFDVAFEHGLAALIKHPEPSAVASLARLLRDVPGDGERHAGAATASRCIIGQVLSLTDRVAAADEFRELRSGSAGELIRHFYWDSGALTYYDASEISATAGEDAAAIIADVQPIRVGQGRNSVAVGISADPAFFRIYGAWLYIYAQQLPNVDFNVFLCAGEEEARQLIADGDGYAAALGRLNLAGAAGNLNFYRMPTPEYVARDKTFYACARFFAASSLLEKYPNVYLMDIDLHMADNPTVFFEEIKAAVFSTPKIESYFALSPWRRHMAGNVALNRGIHGTTLLATLQRYIAHGLRHGGDWMLDQNALAYVVEQDQRTGIYEPLDRYGRPFASSRFMAACEASFMRAAASR